MTEQINGVKFDDKVFEIPLESAVEDNFSLPLINGTTEQVLSLSENNNNSGSTNMPAMNASVLVSNTTAKQVTTPVLLQNKSILKNATEPAVQNIKKVVNTGSLNQTVNNQQLKQMVQLIQQNQKSIVNESSQPQTPEVQVSVIDKTEQQTVTVVDKVLENYAVNIFGLKISKTTIYILIAVVLVLIGGYFYFNKFANNTEKKRRIKEVSYKEQMKLLENKNKKKMKESEESSNEDN